MENLENDFENNKKPEIENQIDENNHLDEVVEADTNIEENNEPILEEQAITETPIEEVTTTPISTPEKKKKNGYKIAFFTMGGIVILGAVGYFGYPYFKKPAVVATENTCLDSDTKIYEAYKDAVVMVKHRYAYFAKINGKEIQLNVPEATEQVLYGTAFFIDKEGSMISNSHVLQPWTSNDGNEEIYTNISNMRRKIASILTTDIQPDGYETFIASNWGNASSEYYEEGGDYHDEGNEENRGEDFVNSADARIDSVATSVDDIAASIPHKNYVSEEDIEVYMKTVDISVALHNSTDEWLHCTIGKLSEDPSVDLGVLQLVSKETPNSVVNIIDLKNAVVDDSSIQPGEKAVMIGYPLGEDLALTSSGVKVQLYNGQISKETDGTKIQYSVTSTNGASGSPIFNHCGQLIAVNFSGIEKIQGYNFGIVTKKINSIYPFLASRVGLQEEKITDKTQ